MLAATKMSAHGELAQCTGSLPSRDPHSVGVGSMLAWKVAQTPRQVESELQKFGPFYYLWGRRFHLLSSWSFLIYIQ